MIFITKCAKLMDTDTAQSEGFSADDEDIVSKGRDFSVLWLTRKMVREAHHEAINNNKVTIKVTLIVNYILIIQAFCFSFLGLEALNYIAAKKSSCAKFSLGIFLIF